MEHDDLGQGLKLAAVAVVSALITTVIVIGAGQAVLSRTAASSAGDPVALIRTGG